MNIIVLRDELVNSLYAVERSVGFGSSLPMLKNVLIRADGPTITVTATNLEFAVIYSFQGKVINSGSISVPFHLLNSVIKNLNSEKLSISVREGNVVDITTDNYNASLHGFDAKDYPIIPSIHKSDGKININIESFTEAIECVIGSTQYSEIRPEISGVFMEANSDSMRFVATDGFRLAEKEISGFHMDLSGLDGIGVIIPLRSVEEIYRLLKTQKEGDLNIFVDQTQILFKTERMEMISRVVDGNFPEYKAIIPKDAAIEAILPRRELMSAIKLTSSFSGKNNDLLFASGENGKFIELSSSDGSVGQNTYRITSKIKGGGFSLLFNWKYLMEGIKIFNTDEVVIGVNADDKPVKIKSAGDISLVYVVVPMKK